MAAEFELLEHTADMGILARGDTLAEALTAAACGMFSVIIAPATVASRQAITVAVNSTDVETLVVDWLNELLYRYEAEAFLPSRFQVTVGEDGASLQATCWGEPLDPARHQVNTVVKAATYHGLTVSHNHQWQIRVILDV